jgi:hypothetical protein
MGCDCTEVYGTALNPYCPIHDRPRMHWRSCKDDPPSEFEDVLLWVSGGNYADVGYRVGNTYKCHWGYDDPVYWHPIYPPRVWELAETDE